MTNRLFAVLSLSLFFFGIWGSIARAGGLDAGNGVDNFRPEDGSAWFVDISGNGGAKASVDVCYRLSLTFGADFDQVRLAIRRSFQKWEAYQSEKGIFAETGRNDFAFPQNLKILDRCDGTQDLTLYFGFSDELTEVFEARYHRPIAFAARTSYEPTRGWGAGIIWVRGPQPPYLVPEWGDNDVLTAVLVHEFGHVFGIGHVKGTIMDSQLVPRLMVPDYGVAEVDHERELSTCWSCDMNAERGYSPEETNEIADGFRIVSGRLPVGIVQARLAIRSGETLGDLELSDQLGSVRIGIQFASQTFFERESEVFSVYFLKDGVSRKFKLPAGGKVYVGTGAYGGKTWTFVLGRNATGELNPGASQAGPLPLFLKILDSNRALPLFSGRPSKRFEDAPLPRWPLLRGR